MFPQLESLASCSWVKIVTLGLVVWMLLLVGYVVWKKCWDMLGTSLRKGVPAVVRKYKSGNIWKMVLCVRTDLGMGKGKIAAQCSHATLGAYRRAQKLGSEYLKLWDGTGEAKVVLKLQNEQEMSYLYKKAGESGLIAYIVTDAGRTQIPAGSSTVLAIGPGPGSAIDAVTGDLKLL